MDASPLPPLPSPILITGAAGFVGRHLRAALLACDPAPSVVCTSLGGEGGEGGLDLTDRAAVEALVARVRPAAVVHLAAQASVTAAAAGGAAATFAVNLGGTLNLGVAAARHAPGAVVLFASSAEVYGLSFGADPVDEDTPLRPANSYAHSKLMAEEALAAVLPADARLIVARPFNHTGAGQGEGFVLPSFAGQIARMEAGHQPRTLRVGNLEAQRDFLDVRDVVAAYVALLSAAPGLPPRFTCNVATGVPRRLADLLEALRRQARVPFTVEVDPARLRALDIPVAIGGSARLAAATGWRPLIPLEDTLVTLLADARRRCGMEEHPS